MGNVKTLFDRQGEKFYPVTGTQAVFDPQGRNLEERLATYPGRSELSNVIAQEPLTPDNFPGINTYTREQLKMDLFIDMFNEAAGDDGYARMVDGVFDCMLNRVPLTYQEAIEIYQLYSRRKSGDYSYMFSNLKLCALLPILIPSSSINIASAFANASNLVKILFDDGRTPSSVVISKISSAFYMCSSLKEISGIMNVESTSDITLQNVFTGCRNLEEFRIKNLTRSIYLGDCPRLSSQTIQYLVANARIATAITITVHPDVYAKLTDETNTEWHQVLIDAAAKNINFATV